MSTGQYPGLGRPLYLANTTFPQEPVWTAMRTADPVIPDDDYSIPFPLNPGIQTVISVIFDSAPTTDAFDVLVSPKGDMSDEYIIESVAASTDTFYQWVSSVTLTGVCRIQNKGTADIDEAYAQSLVTTFA